MLNVLRCFHCDIPPLKLRERVVKFKHYLAARPEQNIAVVSHGWFLRFFTNIDGKRGPGCYPSQKNCELRVYQLDTETLELDESDLFVQV